MKKNWSGMNSSIHYQENKLKIGIFIFKNQLLDLSLLNQFYSLWSYFFSSNEKLLYTGDLNIPVGYFNFIKNNIVSSHEDFYYFPNSTLCPSYIREITDYFFIGLKKISIDFIKKNIKLGFINLEKLLYVMRIIFYKKSSTMKKNLTILNPSHCDKNYFTILPLANNSGLQYYDNGNWKDLTYGQDELLLISGEKLSKYLPPLKHRVIDIYNQYDYRISVAFFVN